ncbi:MAG: hypothetical protein WB767_17480 [Nocardioides sp.]
MAGLDIDSHDLTFGSLVVNGVDVVPLVEAELVQGAQLTAKLLKSTILIV